MIEIRGLSTGEFALVKELMASYAGVLVLDDQRELISMRAVSIARDHDFEDVAAMMRALQKRPFGESHWRVADSFLNHETRFFRDLKYFDGLRYEILPSLIRNNAGKLRLRILSAGCSTGQEPYSIAILLREHFPDVDDWDVRILSGDISQSVLDRARRGEFLQLEVNRGLPAKLMLKYFEQLGPTWRAKEAARDRLEFLQLNLAGKWPPLSMMDLVLLRNVLIYFDDALKRKILAKVADIMQPGGYLVLGSAEATAGAAEGFTRHADGGFIYYTRK